MSLKSSPLITLAALTRAASGFVFALLAVRTLGASTYGYFSVSWSLAGATLFFFGGVNTALVARVVAVRDRPGDEALQLCGAVGSLTLGSALILVLVGVGASVWGSGKAPLPVLYLGVAILLGLQLVTLWCCAALEGHGCLRPAILFPIVGVSTNCVLLAIVWASGWHFDLPIFLLLCAIGYGLEAGFALLTARRHRVLSIDLRSARSELRNLFASGSALQMSSLVGFFLDPFNKSVLLAWLGPGAVALFDLTMKMAWGLQSAFTAYARLFLQIAPGDHAGRIASFSKAAEYVWAPAILAAALVVLWATPLLTSMVGAQPAVAATVLLLALGAILTMVLAAPAYVSLIGIGELGFILRNQLILAAGSSIGALVLVPQLGITGAIWGLLVASAFNTALTWQRVRRHVAGFAGLHALCRGRINRLALAAGSLMAAWALHQTSTTINSWALLGIGSFLPLLLLAREPSTSYVLRLIRRI